MHWRRRPRALPITTTLALAATTALAQSEPPRTDGLWRGTGGASFSAVAGNSTSTTLGLDTAWQRATAQDRWAIDARARYARGETAGRRSTTSNQWAAGGQYDWNLSPRNYAFGKLALEADAVVDLALRHTTSAGLGHKWLASARHEASVFGGAAHTVDRYGAPRQVGGLTDRRFERASLLLGQESRHEVGENTTFRQRLELLSGVSGDKTRLVKFTASMAVAVSQRFSVTLGLSHASNSRPPAGAQRSDTGLLAGLSLRFGAD